MLPYAAVCCRMLTYAGLLGTSASAAIKDVLAQPLCAMDALFANATVGELVGSPALRLEKKLVDRERCIFFIHVPRIVVACSYRREGQCLQLKDLPSPPPSSGYYQHPAHSIRDVCYTDTVVCYTDALATALALARPTSALVGMLGTHFFLKSSSAPRVCQSSRGRVRGCVCVCVGVCVCGVSGVTCVRAWLCKAIRTIVMRCKWYMYTYVFVYVTTYRFR
jgi:hypothetical protein